jgi:hypothetical protein
MRTVDTKTLLDRCLKPEEIASAEQREARIKELLLWFERYSRGMANPKWFEGHAFELAYYIATLPWNMGKED